MITVKGKIRGRVVYSEDGKTYTLNYEYPFETEGYINLLKRGLYYDVNRVLPISWTQN